MVTVMEEWPRRTWTAWGGVGCGEQAGAGVPEVANPQTLRQFCLRDRLVPDLPPEVAVAQRRTVRCGEHERFGVVGNVTVDVVDLVRQLPDLHVPTMIVGAASLVALVALERFVPKVPSVLVVVVGSILLVNWLDLADAGVHIVGEIPSGLPSLAIPSASWSAVVGLIPGAIGVALVVYGESMALSKTFASRHGERVDADQELIALGAGNIGGGLFGGSQQTRPMLGVPRGTLRGKRPRFRASSLWRFLW
jgi:hypothetical protein